MNITEDYVSYEVAKLLKEKGFDEPCQKCYYVSTKNIEDVHNGRNTILSSFFISCPTHQMTMKWLREVHKINIDIKSRWKLNPYKLDYYYFVLHYKNVPSDSFIIKFDSYEEAVEAALKYTLENLV